MRARSPTSVDGATVRWRATVAAVCCLLAAFMVKQAPGRVIADTKLDLTVDPWGFMGRALHMWDPSAYFGQVQNQAYGYFFPMGPFFALGDVTGVPAWLTQRLWLAALVCLAFTGVVRLTGLLGIQSQLARVAAGLAFALSPRLLTGLGPTSVEILPMCLAPWVLVPLVVGSRGGDERRAALRSALVVLCMGGVNAVATAAALPPAVLWLLTRSGGPRRTRLMLWWAAGVVLATAWWAVPLLLLGRYSPDFLSFIESAAVTTGPTALVETLRGTSAWLAYVSGPYGPTLPGGWTLLTNPIVILDTVVIAAFGLAALAWPGTRERRWMVLSFLSGIVLVTAGHVGAVDGLWAGDVRALLDEALAPFRNVHKFDVVLRLPLVLASAFLLERLLTLSAGAAARSLSQTRRAVVLLTATTALAGVALPVLNFSLPAPAPYRSVPGYWRDAADWLAEREGTSLLLPASSFGDYYWGSTRDEPLQALASQPWAVRDAVPLTTAGGIRFLDAVDDVVSSGQPSNGLAEYLARAGIRYLVLRNDLEYGRAQSERPLLVHEAVVGSPGIERVRRFGPVVGGGNAPGRFVDEGLDVPFRAIEVFEVQAWHGSAAMAAVDDRLLVAGGPESLLGLASQDWLGGRPALLVADGEQLPTSEDVPTVLTDGLRRRQVFFGRLTDNASATLGRNEEVPAPAATPDYLEPQWERHLTVSAAVGVRSVSASSSRSDAMALGGARRDQSPWAAMDGDLGTSWRSDPGAAGRASWTVDLGRARPVGSVRLVAARSGAVPGDVTVATDQGDVVVGDLRPGAWASVDLPAGRTRHVTISALPDAALGSFGLAEVRLPGVDVGRTLVLPDGRAAESSWLLVDAGYQRPGCYPVVGTWLCSSTAARGPEEGGSLDRTASLSAGRYVARMAAVPRPGPALNAWLDAGAPAAVTASSTADDGPAGRPGAIVDGRMGTAWRAAPGDEQPWLLIRWPGEETIDGLQLARSGSLAASYPSRVEVSAGDQTYAAKVRPDGRVDLPRMTVRALKVTVTDVVLAGTYDPYRRDSDLLPVGISEIRWSRGSSDSSPARSRLVVPCGEGPTVEADGQALTTRGSARYDDVLSGRRVEFSTCAAGERSGLALTGGLTRVLVRHSTTWDVQTLTLAPPTAARPGSAAGPRPVTNLRVDASGHGNRLDVPVPQRDEPALLWLRQSHNDGWTAEMGGKPLRPVVLDGWQQGFVLPAGPKSTVDVRFSPDRAYRLGLLGGALAAVLLVGLAAWRPRRRAAVPASERTGLAEGGLAAAVLPAALLLLVVAAGWWALAACVLVAGASWVAWRRGSGGSSTWWSRAVLVTLAAGGLAASGVALATEPWPGDGYAAGAGWSQLLCVLSLAAVTVSLTSPAYIGTRARSLMTGLSRRR